MPVEFVRETCTAYGHYTVCDSTKLVMAYDGFGRRISKTRMRKDDQRGYWYTDHVTHYTGIGSEIRKEYHNGELQSTKVVVNMPQGLGRYGIENADGMAKGDEFYLKNHLGSTMMVAQVSSTNASEPAKVAAAYDYRSFGEQVTLTETADKVTENFTGKSMQGECSENALVYFHCRAAGDCALRNERDDETQLNYFGARYLDPMLGVWTSVDPMRQFASPYLYVGNGVNPMNVIDPDGNYNIYKFGDRYNFWFSSRGGTFFFQQMQLQLFGTSLLAYLMSKDERLIESSNKPDMPSTILSLASDAILFTKLIKVISVSPVTNFLFDKAGDLQNVNTIATNIEFWEFDNYMYNLTRSTSISGSSVDDVKAKAAWACEYGLKLYQNDVEIDDKVRQSFNDAYRNEFTGE